MYKLIVTAGPDKGLAFTLTAGQTFQVGRSQAATTRLNDPAVSRVHCENEAAADQAVLPNISTTLIVFAPLMLAIDILTESALSYLSIGVQSPAASWGTIIEDGQGLLYSRPWVSLAPGFAIVLTVLALNVFGDGLRDALDPRSKIKLGGS